MTAVACESARHLLERHQSRREQSIPTLTMLAGPVGLGAQLWRSWASVQGLACAWPASPAMADLAAAWVQALVATSDLVTVALTWLSHSTHLPLDAWRIRLTNLSAHDFEHVWAALPVDATAGPVAALCYWILKSSILGEPPDAAAVLNQIRPPVEDSWPDALAAVADLAPAGRLPALLLTPAENAPVSAAWLDAAARTVGCFVSARPDAPAAIACPAAVADSYLRDGADSHWKALAREGLVAVTSLDEAEVLGRLAAAGVPLATSTTTARRLAADGVSDELAAHFAKAAQLGHEKESLAQEDEARSAAERFLFERLESLPQTAGRFALNQSLEFRHGRAAAEIDLLAADLRLVVELDGSYYHLRDTEVYRRDRRKDWLLQRHGYLVLRFLSDDVVARLEEILDTILAAVELRRLESHRTKGV